MNPETAIPIAEETDHRAMEELAILCKALGNPARIKILRHLFEQDRCICGGIVKVMPLAQSTVSQHLKILKEAGLVQGTVEGPAVCYCVDKNRLASVGRTLAAIFTGKNCNENEK